MKIFVISYNYKDNIKASIPLSKKKGPAVYMKAESALLKDSKPFFVPDFLGNIDFGAHMVVRICRLGKSIPTRFAYRYYDALTIGVAFTARQLLDESLASLLPVDMALGLDGSAAIGKWIPLDAVSNINNVDFHLDVDGEMVQRGTTADMLFNVDSVISYISQFMTLKMGDIIFTGCPTQPILASPDHRIEGWMDNAKVLEMNCK